MDVKFLLSDNYITNGAKNNYLNIDNYDKQKKLITSNEGYQDKLTKNLKSLFFGTKIFLIIIIFCILNTKSKDIDIEHYLDKLYGEEDLLKIIQDKEYEKDKILPNYYKNKIKNINKEIERINDIIEQIKIKKKEKIKNNKKLFRDDGKLTLACSYCLDNGYIYPTLVAMTSLVKNAGNNTFYDIYALVSRDFTEENKQILLSVEKNYNDKCKVNIINMGDKFKGLDTNLQIPTSAYYRLDLQNILPNVDRILYMDGDTAVFQDLSELITLDMKGNYYLGFLDSLPNALNKYNIKNGVVLCSGVLLIDLNLLRQNNISEKYNEFFYSHLGKIEQHDQTTINVVCQGKISTLPPKYGMWNFENFKKFEHHNNDHLSSLKYDKKECLLAYENPAILHYVIGKPFHKFFNKYYYNDWWNYAKITGYYDEIYKYAQNFEN